MIRAHELNEIDFAALALPGLAGVFRRNEAGAYEPLSCGSVTAAELVQAGREIVTAAHCRPGRVIGDFGDVADLLVLHIAGRPREVSGAVLLSADRTLLGVIELAHGSGADVSTTARTIAEHALAAGAVEVWAFHSHPNGGRAWPSAKDRAWHHLMRERLAAVSLDLTDELIIAGADVVSLRRCDEPADVQPLPTDYAQARAHLAAAWRALRRAVRMSIARPLIGWLAGT